jgi:hypothetical protein
MALFWLSAEAWVVIEPNAKLEIRECSPVSDFKKTRDRRPLC